MLRFVVFSLVSFVVIISCMGQTFQYSRGWTNGKRSPSHLHEDPTMAEIFEVPESEKRLERCIIQLQRLIHNPFFLRPSYAATNSNGNSGNIRHQSNEILEDLATSETGHHHHFPNHRIAPPSQLLGTTPREMHHGHAFCQ